MSLLNQIISKIARRRLREIGNYGTIPGEIQSAQFFELIRNAKNTSFGIEHGFKDIKTINQFHERVPVRNYEGIFPYIERLLKGEQNVLWPGEIRWFAKSSGTTNDRSKFIPVSKEALRDCHLKGGRDLLSLYLNNYPQTKIFNGRGLVIGGSHQVNQFNTHADSFYGDLSAVLISNLPFWTKWRKTPSISVALMGEWEEKIKQMARVTAKDNVTSIFGVPTWTVVLIKRILSENNIKYIHQIWPELEVFFHGAVSFTPYQSLFRELIPDPAMNYIETYNASEGFFGIQDQLGIKDLLLMLDYGIYYEFIPIDQESRENPVSIGIDDVELGKNYAVVISTNAGLFRYKIGDTVKFTSRNPCRIKITGRTKHFINAFGEELIIENAEQGIAEACKGTGAIIGDYTAAPRYIGQSQKGGHEWIIEFTKSPDDMNKFVDILDSTMRKVNSDYDAKRYKDIALERPVVHPVSDGTFYQWMKKRNRLGGQNKVPRLVNSRDYIDDILLMLKDSQA